MRKVEDKQITQSYTASEQQNQDVNLGSRATEYIPSIPVPPFFIFVYFENTRQSIQIIDSRYVAAHTQKHIKNW